LAPLVTTLLRSGLEGGGLVISIRVADAHNKTPAAFREREVLWAILVLGQVTFSHAAPALISARLVRLRSDTRPHVRTSAAATEIASARAFVRRVKDTVLAPAAFRAKFCVEGNQKSPFRCKFLPVSPF